MTYAEMVKLLRNRRVCIQNGGSDRDFHLWDDAADAIEELLKAARAMHLWIFLNTGDEEKAYEECGLSDEMNAALGYGGRIEIAVPKEDA